MINGHLSEAQQGFAVLDDVDQATFLAFSRWTYSQDYSVSINGDTTASTAENAPPTDDPWGEFDWGSKKDKKKKGKNRTEPAVHGYLRESFVSHQRETGTTPYSALPARAPKGPDEDYTEVFLFHARIYVFAEKYDIQPLKQLAVQKLQHQLAIHTLYIERTGDIVALLKYVYANTASSSSGTDDIRTMLAHYVGVEMGNLAKQGEIKTFMQEEPEFLSDFLDMIALRVN